MKTTVKASVFILLTIFFFSLTNCKEPDEPDRVIDIAAVQLTAPFAGEIPLAVITETEQFTGTVIWSPIHDVFQNSTVYFATITLTPKRGYLLEGVTADFFKVAGANKVNNDANSGVITAIFPRTAGTIDNPAVIDIQTIDGIAPVSGATPKTEISPNSQYTGTITWEPDDNPFKASIVYTANITLTPKAGFTFTGITADFFTVIGAETANNEASSNLVTAVFMNNHTHRWGEWSVTTPATCTIEGVETRVCNYDSSHKETRQISINPDAHGGNWTAIMPITSINEVKETLICSYNPAHNGTRTGTLRNNLSRLPANTADSPYILTLNISDLGGDSDTSGSLGNALYNNKTKYVSLDLSGSTITSIPNSAFYWSPLECTNLTGITIPNSVSSIGDVAFAYCISLIAINVDSGNANYSSEDGVLYNKNKTSLYTYPRGKTGTTFTIPDSVTRIENEAFRGCSSLTSLTIPNSVTSIEYEAFYGCKSLTSLTIPNSVTSIGQRAFSDCTGLTSVTIGNSVTSIVAFAFYSCDSLTSITIPNSVTSIGRGAFSACTSLNAINVDAANTAYSSQDGVLYNKNKTTLVAYPGGKTGAFTIINSVTIIEQYAFQRCSSLTSVTIGNGVIDIRYYAFNGCRNLASVTIGNSVTFIGSNAFQSCSSLTSVTIPDSVTSIGREAFWGCSSLISVNIGNGVTSIGDLVFCYCTSLASVTIPNSVTSIGEWVFSHCTGLTGVTIPNSVTSIGGYAFSDCTRLTSVRFEGTIISSNFNDDYSFDGDLRTKYLAGGKGTYTRSIGSLVWTKQS